MAIVSMSIAEHGGGRALASAIIAVPTAVLFAIVGLSVIGLM